MRRNTLREFDETENNEEGLSRVLAFELMKNVRKGKGGSESVQRLLKEYGAGEDTCEELKKIKHLCSEGTCLLGAQIIRYLMRKTVGIS